MFYLHHYFPISVRCSVLNHQINLRRFTFEYQNDYEVLLISTKCRKQKRQMTSDRTICPLENRGAGNESIQMINKVIFFNGVGGWSFGAGNR